MQDILPDLDEWVGGDERIALATVVRTTGSTPRPVGAKMAMLPSGKMAGSVSGGCLESDVFEEAMQVLETGVPRVLHYGITDEMAWTVGLACGGTVDLFVEELLA
ncbi:MAG: XdhC family protein [Chloroflexota bacterium]